MRVDHRLADELRELGARNISQCYSCGVCTAICPLSEEGREIPRRMVRYAVLGLRDRLERSLEPWLCYYCGECTKSCPRGADPGALMMAVRRYLITRYDFTGISRVLYRSPLAEALLAATLFLAVVLGVYFLHGPVNLERVDMESFLPAGVVDAADIAVAATLASLLLANAYRMYRLTRRGPRLPLTAYITELVKTVPPHFFTQLRMLKCRGSVRDWVMHALTAYGYGIVFVLVVLFLRAIHAGVYPAAHPLRLAGYVASALLLAGAGYAIYGRARRSSVARQYSHPTDWLFLILLLLTTLTGVALHVFKYLNMPLEAYVCYAVHLGLAAPLLILEVPFAKWSHIAYRPLAIYFARLNELRARRLQPSP